MSKTFKFHSIDNTHQGNVRQLNEDSILSVPSSGLWGVADGMGGHSAGEVASQMIVEDLSELPEYDNPADLLDVVEDTLLSVNQKLRAHSVEFLQGQTIGSTVVCLILKDSVGVALWVGDSRLYRFRDGQLTQMTKDHSEVQARLDSGLLTPEQAENSSIKNILSRAVGAFDKLDVDINAFIVEPDDLFLLCSDGLYNELNVEEMASVLSAGLITEMSDTLMRDCLSRDAKDNVSFILVKASNED